VRKEIVVTPNPKTKKQARANKKVERLAQALQRQEQEAHAPHKKTARAKRADRELKHKINELARDADSRK
jgi:hypothetical protein